MPAQTLNLLDARLVTRRVAFSAAQTFTAVAAVLLLGTGASSALHMVAGPLPRASTSAPPVMPLAPTAAAELGALQGELERLQQVEASQQHLLAVLQSQIAATPSASYSEVFMALARRAGGPVWITGFSVGGQAQAVDLEGRMLDTASLTDYLRQLNSEPQFSGRPFAQLNLQTVEPPASEEMPRVTAFALRSQPADAGGRQ